LGVRYRGEGRADEVGAAMHRRLVVSSVLAAAWAKDLRTRRLERNWSPTAAPSDGWV